MAGQGRTQKPRRIDSCCIAGAVVLAAHLSFAGNDGPSLVALEKSPGFALGNL